MSKQLYTIKNLTKEFGKNDALTTALKGVSLNIKEGELIAITGPSGCGKTTLLNLLTGLITPTNGTICFENHDIFKWKDKELSQYRNQSIGYIMQNFGLINSLTVIKNTLLPVKNKSDRNKKKNKALEILDVLGIKNKEKNYPFELSGGQKQRVAIARALMNEPKIIFADEPTGALDLDNSQKIIDILKEINNKGTTVVIVTHQQELAKQCHRIVTLEDGEIVNDKTSY